MPAANPSLSLDAMRGLKPFTMLDAQGNSLLVRPGAAPAPPQAPVDRVNITPPPAPARARKKHPVRHKLACLGLVMATLAPGTVFAAGHAAVLNMVPPPAAVALYQSVKAAPPTPLTTVLRSNFDKFSGGKGYISPEDVKAQLQNSKLTGDSAAAVAFMATFQDANHWNVSINKTLILEYEEAHDGSDNYSAWDDSFSTAQSTLKTVGADKLIDNSGPILNSFKQATWIGDCYIDSNYGAVWYHHPDQAKTIVTQTSPHEYKVDFPGYTHPEKVKLTDAEIAWGAQGDAGDSTSLAQLVVEIAAGQIRNHNVWTQLLGQQAPTALDAVGSGGSAGWGLTLMTGHATRGVNLHAKDYTVDDLRADLSANLPTTYDGTTPTSGPNNIVAASTNASVDGVPENHALTDLAFNPKTDEVVFWNPWGFEPTDANVHDYGHGVEGMQAPEYLKAFTHLSIEEPNTSATVGPFNTDASLA